MNEQPQQPNLPPVQQHEGSQPLYKAENAGTSSFSGYDLAATPQVVPNATNTPVEEAPHPDEEHVDMAWEASEYIHHTKSPLWFMGYAGIMLVLLAIAYFLTQAWTFIVLVVVMAIAIGVFATRPPRTLRYALTDSGLQIEESHYHYNDFRAFGIIADGGLYSIMLIPTKRFMPAVSIYFAEDDGEKIVDILGSRLPMEELHLDFVDRMMRRLRF
ncbi:MAG TPA: hypothetical protein VJM46_05235 [Candidatus Saccharimonadales bacterium]|nr:hypothetical protein [Candidatus Saccharimonadales bacterium]